MLYSWRRKWQPTPVLLPGQSHGWRSLVGYSPCSCWESDRTERFHFHFALSCIGEGNGNPLQYSCLVNPRDRGTWWAAVYGVAQSQTRLKRLSSSSSSAELHVVTKSRTRLSHWTELNWRHIRSYCSHCSVTKSCLTPCDSMDCSTMGFPVLHYLSKHTQIHVHPVMLPKHLILRLPLRLLPSAFPSIRVFSNELSFHSQSCLFISKVVSSKLELQHQSFQWIFRVDFL